MIKVLHITAHLGGGVGKALSGLVLKAVEASTDIIHTIVTLEQQEKLQFIEQIEDCGCEVIICPTVERIYELVAAADIVQLEWWNHPLTIKTLCNQHLPAMRLLVWSHVSGLFNPIIPRDLILVAQQFLFTSACSFEAKEVLRLPSKIVEQIRVVSSSGGYDGLPCPESKSYDNVVTGYIGSLNFAKLHPCYVDFLAAVNIPQFRVKLIGDVTNKDKLEQQCGKLQRMGMLEFRGYSKDIALELSSINVLAYLLNPEHYGTTENALLETMAMGIVPIVLNNPAERLIVDDRNTGLVVNSPKEFADAIHWLNENPDELRRLGQQAAASVRSKYTVERMEASLALQYRSLLTSEKKVIFFSDIFGNNPAEWFMSCQSNRSFFFSSDDECNVYGEFSSYGLLEKTKGTAYHFRSYFPGDNLLANWVKKLDKFNNVREGSFL